jgi:hypothetical protein
MSNPYIDKGSVRVFLHTVDDKELVWHRDREDRTIKVIDGTGWQFQFDDSLPFDMKVGDVIEIKAMRFHRIIKIEATIENLVLNIEKHRT